MRNTIYCALCVLITVGLLLLSGRFFTNLWILAFFESLQLQFSVMAIIGAVVALLFRRHWYALLVLAWAVALCVHALFFLHARTQTPVVSRTTSIHRLLSFNIENDNYANGKAIADFILKTDADVVEIFEAEPLLHQLTRLNAAYPYQIGCGALTQGCDSLLLSKRPFQQQSLSSLGFLWRDRLIKAQIDFDGKPLTFISTHISKPYFDDFHDDDLEHLKVELDAISGPLIVAGDFNASLLAPDMLPFLRHADLRHVFPEPATWPVGAERFGIAIDHVFARAPAYLESVDRIPDAMGSNHYGLITQFSVRQ